MFRTIILFIAFAIVAQAFHAVKSSTKGGRTAMKMSDTEKRLEQVMAKLSKLESMVKSPPSAKAAAPPAMSSEALAFFNRPGPWEDKDLGSLLDANKAWRKRVSRENPGFFDEIKKGHAPKILWVGCSDARVPANEIIGQPPGAVFVHRNIANQVVNTDFNLMSVLQYGIEVLKVKHVIVCGHYQCGGVAASLANNDHQAPLENWLRHIRDVQRLHQDELDAITDITQKQRRLVELNVIEQCINIYKTASVQKTRMKTYEEMVAQDAQGSVQFPEPQVHGFVYEPGTGVITKLDIDFEKYLDKLKPVYSLYQE